MLTKSHGMRPIVLVAIIHFVASGTTSASQADWTSTQNVCEGAVVTSHGPWQTNEDLQLTVDGDLETGIDATLIPGSQITISFSIRPPRVNAISIVHGKDLQFTVAIMDIYKNRRDILAEVARYPCRGSGIVESQFTTDELRATGVTIDLPPDLGGPRSKSVIYEVKAYDLPNLNSEEPLDDGIPEVAVGWIDHYRHTKCDDCTAANYGNLTHSQRSAVDLSVFLTTYADYIGAYARGNADMRKSHIFPYGRFTSEQFDDTDFGFFQGRGITGHVYFSYPDGRRCWGGFPPTPMPWRCIATALDCNNDWGDSDLEWLALWTNRSLKVSCWDGSDFWERRWRDCFDGLRLLCGFGSNACDIAGAGSSLGVMLAQYSWDWTVAQSWLNTGKWLCGSDCLPRIFAANIASYTDFLSDYNKGNLKEPDGEHLYVLESRLAKGSRLLEAPARSELQFLEQSGVNAPPILVSHQLLVSKGPAAVPELNVVPNFADSTWAADLADHFYDYHGWMDPGTRVYESDQAFAFRYVFDGPYELRIYDSTTSFVYIESEQYGVPPSTPPDLISPDSAMTLADHLLQELGMLPPDAVRSDTIYSTLSCFDMTTGDCDQECTYDFSVGAVYSRVHSGYRIEGPGSSIQVEFGQNGEPLQVFYGGWRELVEGPVVPTISLAEALEDLAEAGSEIAIGSMPSCDTFVVASADIGYYEKPWTNFTEELDIVWLIDGLCIDYIEETDTYDTTETTVMVPALFRHPWCSIEQPSSDTAVAEGEPIILAGSATSGTPPYTFTWESDIDGWLGNDPAIEVPALSLQGGEFTVHTVWLEANDANSLVDVEAVTVEVVPIADPPSTEPHPMYAVYAFALDSIDATAYVEPYDMPADYTLDEIDQSTLMINEEIVPSGSAIIGDVLEVYFDARDLIESFGLIWDQSNQVYTISGVFTDGEGFVIHSTVECIGHRAGDADLDGQVDVDDIVFILNFVFSGGTHPLVTQTADANCDGEVGIDDVVTLIAFIFSNGPAPCHN
jgi:hypothetical protein